MKGNIVDTVNTVMDEDEYDKFNSSLPEDL